jgi:hypothetical protein
MPFEVLMVYASSLSAEDEALTMGQLSERWGEPAERIMDALDAVRVLRGERTYVTVDDGEARL